MVLEVISKQNENKGVIWYTLKWIMISGIAICLINKRESVVGVDLGLNCVGQSQDGVGRSGNTVFG